MLAACLPALGPLIRRTATRKSFSTPIFLQLSRWSKKSSGDAEAQESGNKPFKGGVTLQPMYSSEQRLWDGTSGQEPGSGMRTFFEEPK